MRWGTKGTRLSALAHAVGGCENSPPFLWLKFASWPSLVACLARLWSSEDSVKTDKEKAGHFHGAVFRTLPCLSGDWCSREICCQIEYKR